MSEQGSAALDSLYWRSEILQAIFWMAGEGLAESVAPDYLAQFLVAEEATVRRELARLTEDGFLTLLANGQFRLTEDGRREGGRSFADEFDGLTKPAHGECAPGCHCHDPAFAGEPCISHSPGLSR